MNLYHVSQNENNDYDTYSDFVIACETEEEARNTNPSGGDPMTQEDWDYKYSSWASSSKNVSVMLIGEANRKVKKGIICSSYHAG